MDYVSLGREIRRARQAKKMRQHEVAALADISLSFMGHIERGSRKASIETLLKVAKAVGATPNDLLIADLGGEGSPQKPCELIVVNLEKLARNLSDAVSDATVSTVPMGA